MPIQNINQITQYKLEMQGQIEPKLYYYVESFSVEAVGYLVKNTTIYRLALQNLSISLLHVRNSSDYVRYRKEEKTESLRR